MSNNQIKSAPVRVNPESWVKTVRAAWQAAGHRITEPRERLLHQIAGYSTPFSAEQLYADLQRSDDAPGRATVYRTLEQLHSSAWLARIHTGGLETGYIATLAGHVHHLVCTECGMVIAFEGCMLDDLLCNLAEQTSFSIESHLLQIYGRCARCARNREKK